MEILFCYPGGKAGNYEIPESVTKIGTFAFSYCRGLTSLTIPEDVTSIDSYAFFCCSGLTDIIIPEGVTSIGGRAFSGCSALTSAKIPPSVTTIGEAAFVECSELTSLTIPKGVTNIGYEFFKNCKNLKVITIPYTVIAIGDEAFQYCDSLTDVYFIGDGTQWETINIGENNESLFNASIHYVIEPVNPDLILPAALTEIGNEAFAGGAFTFVMLPEGLTSIGKKSFENCPYLNFIYIPPTTTTIDQQAFGDKQALTILGKFGSVAEIYALEHGFRFVDYP